MAASSVLLVEGRDDQHVIGNLIKHYNLHSKIEVKPKGGDFNLIEWFRVELKASDLQRLAVVVDADESLANRWQSIFSMLVSAGYTGVPKTPSREATVIAESGKPPVGIWIMPDNTVEGILEDFVARLVPEGDPLWPKAQGCVSGIEPDLRRFQSVSKANIHTWLAWQERPGIPLGLAITQKCLNPGAPQASEFISWIRKFLDT